MGGVRGPGCGLTWAERDLDGGEGPGRRGGEGPGL